MKKLLPFILFLITTSLFSQQHLRLELQDSSRLKLSVLDIQVKIIGNYAATTYDMQFYNGLERTLEGELIFPLGEGQTVSRFAMEVNGKLREAAIVEKELARVAFESTVRQNIDPGLLEKTEGNNYKARIYPILPESFKRVVITHEHELSSVNGELIYELPLGFDSALDQFTLNIEVYGSGSNERPLIENKLYAHPNFKENNGFYIYRVNRKNHKPTEPVVIRIPNTNPESKILTNNDYFYVFQKLDPEVRKKSKPKKITILWDASFSMRYRNLEKELSFLNHYFQYLNEVEVIFISFNNTIQREQHLKILDGNWTKLKTLIKGEIYDGGTSFNSFQQKVIEGDEILFFSDGMANLGEWAEIPEIPIYPVNSLVSANHEYIRNVAASSGGTYINLVRQSPEIALQNITQEIFQFLGVDHNSSITEVYPNDPINVEGSFSIAGKFSNEAELELLFGYGGKVTQRKHVNIQRIGNDSIVKRLWAKKKLEYLNLRKNQNQEAIISLAKKYYLVTDFTSMLILDRVEDYVRYKIEPPKELRKEYKELLIKFEEEEASRQEELEDRKADLQDGYNDLLEWHKTDFAERNKSKTNINPEQSEHPSQSTIPENNNLIAQGRPTEMNNQIDTTRRIISGVVLDADGNPLPGANIVVKGTNNNTQTGFDGNFAINADENDQIIITYIGFVTKEADVGENDNIAIRLTEDSQSLDEVVIVGYGISKEVEMTASVFTIESGTLQGRATGVQIERDNSYPEEDSSLTANGENTNSGSMSPLYIVDGEVQTKNPLPDLNPEDVEEMQVLRGLNASAIYGSKAANGAVIIITKNGLEEKKEEIDALNEVIAEKIELKSWDPNMPYIQILNKESALDAAYKKYLELRDEYGNSPTFYLDVSDYFHKKSKADIAITILTNLMEIEIDNHEIMRALAYKLEYYKEYDLAVEIYKHIMDLRPEEPQSYRDLALAYERLGQIEKAFDLLYSIYSGELLEKDENERFRGIEQIAFVELSRLVHKYDKELKIEESSKDLFKEIPVDVRVVIDWNHNDTDIDLSVTDPKEETAYYGNSETNIGGRISEDMTEGYGPEEFMLKNALKGKYEVFVDYFADTVQKISGPTILKVTLYTNYARKNEKSETIIVRLDQEEDELEVANFEF